MARFCFKLQFKTFSFLISADADDEGLWCALFVRSLIASAFVTRQIAHKEEKNKARLKRAAGCVLS